jgi:hypothetical protein
MEFTEVNIHMLPSYINFSGVVQRNYSENLSKKIFIWYREIMRYNPQAQNVHHFLMMQRQNVFQTHIVDY